MPMKEKTMSSNRKLRRAALRSLLCGMLALPASAAFLASFSTPVAAQSAAAKAAVDAAKARGVVGEQGDGYLGFVTPQTDPTLAAAVAEINSGRMQAYRETAMRTGVTPEAAAQATAQQLFARLGAGQYFKPLDGNWVRK
jgi:uncharacterized protein YdbL (DUF1318 family)